MASDNEAPSIYLRGLSAELVEQIDAVAEKQAAPHTRPNRVAAAIYLIERGLADATRERKKT